MKTLLRLMLCGFLFLIPVFLLQGCHNQASNIFDEIYSDEISYLKSNASSSIKLIEIKNTDLVTDKQSSDFKSGSLIVVYRSDDFPENSSLNIIADKEGLLTLSYEEKLDEKVHLSLRDRYDTKEKKMTQELAISDYDSETVVVPESDLDTYFDKYNLSKEDIQKKFALFENQLFKDWLSVYDSNFSVDNWGDLNLEKW